MPTKATDHTALPTMCSHDNTATPPAGTLCLTCGTYEDDYFGKVYVPDAALAADMLAKVTGQLAALQQANDTLVEKWRGKEHFANSAGSGHGYIWRQTADELEAATKEAGGN